jgi:predicted nucleic acid-binding protein
VAAGAPTRIVVTDANIIINLIHAGRLALPGALPPYEFVVPEGVMSEIVDPVQREALEAAITAGHLRRETMTAPAELMRYAELREIVGKGEAACLALAESRGWLVASDEKRRFRREVLARLGSGRLVTTPGLFVLAIRAGARCQWRKPTRPRRSSSGIGSACRSDRLARSCRTSQSHPEAVKLDRLLGDRLVSERRPGGGDRPPAPGCASTRPERP